MRQWYEMGIMRELKNYFFQCLQLIFATIEWCWLYITTLGNQRNYENSASVSRIFWRRKLCHPYEDYHYGKEDFVSFHLHFTHPSVILKDDITLYSVSPSHAYFVDCQSYDVFSENMTFMHVTQFEQAVTLISIPIEYFHRIADEIEKDDVKVLHITNHGRCGSTLMHRIFQSTTRTLSMGEPFALAALAEYTRQGYLSLDQQVRVCKSIFNSLLKHTSTRKVNSISIETCSTCIVIADVMATARPSLKQIYLYRQLMPFAHSWEKLQLVNQWPSPISRYLLYYFEKKYPF